MRVAEKRKTPQSVFRATLPEPKGQVVAAGAEIGSGKRVPDTLSALG